MKQKNQKQFKLYYFQESFHQENSTFAIVIGLGVEQMDINKQIGINLSQSFKNGDTMLMRSIDINDEELRKILQEYLTEEEQKQYVFERPEEYFDQFNIFKHLVKEQVYLAILPRGQFVLYQKNDKIDKINLDDSIASIREHLQQFKELDQTQKEFHLHRILYNMKEQIDGELPQLGLEKKQKEFKNAEEKLEYEVEMRQYTGKALFSIPTFDKTLVHYNWDNMQQIPQKLLFQQ
ncbi:unnamed protein product (macronuclear) [Paramecium tetraurelia]|uniref:Uncharacterized protein n=1 Tax=Paramecium tetraurelia TaxID=5888 RepID=A0CN20_PARTE|nr:uncharacterized protein GSPATT00008628001 [Paramecium tetraurelia]CAK72187.1 unnamed protein product [Paramecium tetraurelia]|eukprot:XP_001439584.1 hypothetical protein (macronuclear) [Paramecium tetraurelia strain d4-2]